MDNKMRNIIFHILIISYLLIICSAGVSLRYYMPCPLETYHVGNWTFENDTLPPVNITVVENGPSQIKAEFPNNRSNDFKLTVFGNVDNRIKDGSECPPLNTSDPNLRKWHRNCNLVKEANYTGIQYENIFTGCFYFVITNNEEKHWIYGPKFYKTSYKYLDTRVTLDDWHFKPESKETSNSLKMDLTVPLDCIPVWVKLYEYKIKHTDAMNDIRNDALTETQSCWISMKGGNLKKNCMLKSHITLEVNVEERDGKWIIYLSWDNLIRGGANYYFQYSNPDLHECRKQYNEFNLTSWKLIDGRNYIEIDEWYGSNAPKERKPDDNFPWLLTTSCIASFIFIIIMLYGILKWYRLRGLIADRNKRPEMMEEPIPATFDEIESDKILLIYVKDCLFFKERLDAFKLLLEKQCSGYKIKDVYAINEWPDIAARGATEWVEQQLNAGSKVVWVDTPQFRSRLNDKEKAHTWADSRDEAAPHAVDVARTLFQNAKTQYCRHFVVRMKGFEVDDRQEDPLQMFTPYVRYYIPDHLSLLCEHLKGPMERLIKKENLYTVIKLDSSLKNGNANKV